MRYVDPTSLSPTLFFSFTNTQITRFLSSLINFGVFCGLSGAQRDAAQFISYLAKQLNIFPFILCFFQTVRWNGEPGMCFPAHNTCNT